MEMVVVKWKGGIPIGVRLLPESDQEDMLLQLLSLSTPEFREVEIPERKRFLDLMVKNPM